MQKLAGHIIIFSRILVEGADEQSWRDLEPYNFRPDSFWFFVCHTWSNLSVVPPAHAQRVYMVIFGLPPQSHKFPGTFFLRFVGGIAPQFFCHNFDTFTKITFFHLAASPPSQFHLFLPCPFNCICHPGLPLVLCFTKTMTYIMQKQKFHNT